MCKTVNVIVDAENTGELDVPAEGSKASKPIKESTPVPGIIKLIAFHVKMCFNSVVHKYFGIKWEYVLYLNRWWWLQCHP